MSINSQAFVGTQNLQQIDIENCPSLETGSRQVIQNVTASSTSRILQRNAHISANQTEASQNGSSPAGKLGRAIELAQPTSLQNLPLPRPAGLPRSSVSESQQQYVNEVLATYSNKLKYVYYLATLTFLAVALKLVFKFSSSSRYMESRRRRRRVYEADGSLSGAGACALHSVDSFSFATSSSESDNDSGCQSFELRQARSRSWSLSEGHQLDRLATGALRRLAGSCGSIYRLSGQQEAPHPDVIASRTTSFAHHEPDVGVLEDDGSVIGGACCLAPVPPSGACTCTESTYEGAFMAPVDQAGPPLELIRSQMLAAGLDFGHANCAHFCRSLHLSGDFADYY